MEPCIVDSNFVRIKILVRLLLLFTTLCASLPRHSIPTLRLYLGLRVLGTWCPSTNPRTITHAHNRKHPAGCKNANVFLVCKCLFSPVGFFPFGGGGRGFVEYV